MRKFFIIFTLLVLMMAPAPRTGAKNYSFIPLCPGLEPARQSTAYQQFLHRPRTDFSRILYMIDRFAPADAKVIYDGYHYSARFAGKIARWFLMRRYRGQTAEAWIIEWCNRSIIKNELIWVQYPDGSMFLARDILMKELQILKEELSAVSSDAASSPV